MSSRRAACALLALACAVGPDYRRPSLPVPDDYRGPLAPADAASIANRPWWDLFRDPALAGLIDAALRENLDVKLAAARVEEARAGVVLARAGGFPQLSGSATGSYQHLPAALGGGPGFFQTWELAASASWELDLWGKYRRAGEAARAQLFASEMGRRAAVTTVVADVARSWTQLAALSEQIQVTRDAIASAEESLALVRRLAEGGVSSDAEVRQAELQLLTFQVQLPSLERQRWQLEDALSVILGRPPEAIATPAAPPALVAGPEVPAGLPSELLARRPDVVGAEQALVAANANVGVAKAAFFPRLSLTGLLGVVSASLENLLTHGGTVSRAGGALDLPIFAGGRDVANYRIARARAEEAAVQYRATVLGALRDVADALVETAKRREELEGQQRRVATSQEALKLITERFRAGIASYLDVLDSMRSLYSARIDLVTATAARQIGVIQLYQALGGGWTEARSEAAAAPPAPVPAPAGEVTPGAPRG